MALILLESLADSAIIKPSDGAAVNLVSAGKKSGRIWGCAVTLSSSVFTMAAGILMARGYRIKVDASTQILDLSSATLPATDTAYKLIARVSRSGDNASLSITYQLAGSSTYSSLIEEGNGTYDLVIGTFKMGPGGVSDFSDSMQTLTGGSGGGGSSDFGSTLPAPELELVGDRGANALDGLYLCLRNKGDYNPYATGYTVVLKVFRYRKRAKHRKKSGSTKVYYMKEGWHQPAAGLAPWNVNDPNPIPSRLDLAELREVDIVSSGGFSYSRKDVICEVSSIIQALWYDIETGTKYHVATTSNAYHIRVTGSKNLKASKRGRWGKIAKNNFLKIAFRAYIYSGNSLVAKSPIGDALVITPQLGGASQCPMRARIE